MSVLIVHANSSRRVYQSLAKDDSAIEPPIWAGLLCTSLQSKGLECDLLDCEVGGLTTEESAKRIADGHHKILCFVVYGQQPSASSQNMTGAVELAERVKLEHPEKLVVFIGAHVAALPTETLRRHSFIDVVCTNEGVRSLHALAQIDARRFLSEVPGIQYREENGEIRINQPSLPIEQSALEHWLPGINWDLFSLDQYRTAGWHSWSNGSNKTPFAAIYTSLGCPYRCDFCMINIINRSSNSQVDSSEMSGFRYWNPEFTLKQIDVLVDRGVRNLKIADELFVLNPRHFISICDGIIARGYDLNIWAYARVDTCKPRYLEKLRRAGVQWLGLGIENPDQKRRKWIHKGSYEEVNIVSLLEQIKSFDINVGGNYIFGLPGEDRESMNNTLMFAKENLTEMANFYCAMAYPGSPLYRTSSAQGVELPHEYSEFSQHSYDTKNLPTEHLTAAEILSFRDQAWLEYHSSQTYEALLIKRFGVHAVEQIRDTRKKKLKRKLLGD